MPPKRKKNAPASTSAQSSTSLQQLSVAELKKLCTEKGLATQGKKADLIKLLENTNEDEPASKKVALSDTKVRNVKPDDHCPIKGNSEVYKDFDCMLNQTSIEKNNNKYYVIQLLFQPFASKYFVWNRWGRVGEPGQNSLKGPYNDDKTAEKEFVKKFQDKTGNKWENRDNFVAKPSKYTLLEIDDTDEVDTVVDTPVVKVTKTSLKVKLLLDLETTNFIELIFNSDMFETAMTNFQLDVKKMPLGKLSKQQISKGFDILLKLEEALADGKDAKELEKLSSNFYTLIPHSFGRNRPPVLNDQKIIDAKKEILAVLGDIEIAQNMLKDSENEQELHPVEANYRSLDCQLELLSKNAEDYKNIMKYSENTGSDKMPNLSIWKVARKSEEKRFALHDNIENRKLLWHGTNLAVVAAILKTGLRIMPHSGGRVGKGIYFASEKGKSEGYAYSVKGYKVMFLCEVALGKEHHITNDNSSLKKAPKDFDSVVARGNQEPDPRDDIKVSFDKHEVIIPQGKPVKQGKPFDNSSFWQSEYLVYQESQCRIRYVLKYKFP